MILEKSRPLATLVARQPAFVRPLVRSALCVHELDQLYREACKQGRRPLSQALLHCLGIDVQLDEGDLTKIPASGPLVVVANHPFGLLDGLILHSILERSRADIKILVNDVLCAVPELAGSFIPVDVFGPRACGKNLSAARAALRWLSNGHGVAVFPSGTVSHWHEDEKRITDPEWHAFPVRCALAARGPIVPIYFGGRNSLTFQLVGLLDPRLRTARLPRELLNKRGARVDVRIGVPVTYRQLADLRDEQVAIEHARARVYLLRNRPTAPNNASAPLLVLPARFRGLEPISPPIPGVSSEIKELDKRGKRLVENESYSVYRETGHRIPLLLSEIGRLRELTFRGVQEGTGKRVDLDEFDPSYTHLILWHKPSASVAGAYRLAWTTDVFASERDPGLYTSKLFRYTPDFFLRLGPAVEVGRSFVTQEHQREYAALLLLWQGIGRCVAARPDAPVLFGAVSISTKYPQAARELIVQFLRERSFRQDLAPFVAPRRAFHCHLLQSQELNSITRCLDEVDDLPIKDLGSQEAIPVLLRHYLRLGGKVAGFNLDSRFSNVLDALLVLDLRQTPRKQLVRYMGAEMSQGFLERAQAVS